MSISLSEALKKSLSNKNNLLHFKLGGEEVEAVVKWNTASLILIDKEYKGGHKKFSEDLNKIQKTRTEKPKKNEKTKEIPLDLVLNLNTMIVWALLVGGGQAINQQEAKMIADVVITDTAAMAKCYATISGGDINEADLEGLIKKEIEKEDSELKKKTEEQ